MTLADLPAVAQLPAAEKLTLVGELWDAIAAEGLPPLTPDQRAELDRRRAAFEADPASGRSWEQVKAGRGPRRPNRRGSRVVPRSLTYTPDADDDVFDAFRWYERRQVGLGDRFLAALEERLDSIRAAPDQYEPLGDGYRRAIVGRFPYSVIFTASADRVVVYAVPHHSRDETTWRRRLR